MPVALQKPRGANGCGSKQEHPANAEHMPLLLLHTNPFLSANLIALIQRCVAAGGQDAEGSPSRSRHGNIIARSSRDTSNLADLTLSQNLRRLKDVPSACHCAREVKGVLLVSSYDDTP